MFKYYMKKYHAACMHQIVLLCAAVRALRVIKTADVCLMLSIWQVSISDAFAGLKCNQSVEALYNFMENRTQSASIDWC